MKKEICNFVILILFLILVYFILNFNIYVFFLCLFALGILFWIRYKFQNIDNSLNNISPTLLNESLNKIKYNRKNFMTKCEYDFYLKLSSLKDNYIVIPQLNLATVIEKRGSSYCNELFRNIDFAIFDKNYNLLLLIELNDKTHNNAKRHKRDLKVKKILDECNIPLLIFYTYYPNEKQYVLNRIIKNLKANNLFKDKNN